MLMLGYIDAITDIGIKRKDNQDNYWVSRLQIGNRELEILCVCDGMGGLTNGGIASEMVVRSVREAYLGGKAFLDLKGVLEETNKQIYNREERMGTTCTIVEVEGDFYRVWHVGDSRFYIYRLGELIQVTTDHSALKKYNITKDNPYLYKKYKNSLTRCIGVQEEVNLDYIEGSLQENDILLVCSDGLWHFFDDRDCCTEDLEDLNGLVSSCINAGETDNITCVMLS